MLVVNQKIPALGSADPNLNPNPNPTNTNPIWTFGQTNISTNSA